MILICNYMAKDISLEQSLNAYRVMNTPTTMSWKQHWVKETFSHDILSQCSPEEQKKFAKRLSECEITICPNIKSHIGTPCNLSNLIDIVTSKQNKNILKPNRKVVYGTSNGERPVGAERSIEIWNGFQIIDMDIKNAELSERLKKVIFNKLHNCNWFFGVVLSSSGTGLHIYTKITVPQNSQEDINKKTLLYHTNFRHKYSFIYLACLPEIIKEGYVKEDLIKWMDLSMSKPQQGGYIGYDANPLFNTHFFEDFIYVNFDNVIDLNCPEIDWITYPDLKEVFKRWEWFEKKSEKLNIKVLDKGDLKFDTHNKVHYKHDNRWRLANTLVKLYGAEMGFKYLRMICSNAIKDKELQADCMTASRHDKSIDVWAVNTLNSIHGFQIKLNIQDTAFDESMIFNSMERISNPTIIQESPNVENYHLTKDQYLGNIRHQLLNDAGRVSLIDAGAGLGKTEMVKQISREGHKILLVMPFTSTIKAKVENESNWDYSYGNRRPRLDSDKSLCLTVDKFSHLNMMDIKTSGFDYIFIDESHLLFQSEYRPVMAKVIEMIRNTEVPIIMMSGTPSGEMVFFPDIVHLKVVKDDVRRKELKVTLVDNTSHLMYHMCRQMANDISNGKRILFPTNSGTLYSEQIKAAVTYFLQNEHANFDEVKLKYYKKSNIGEQFMDDVNFKKTVSDSQILMCTNYLSVGVDILDKYNFSIYFADLMMPQEVEQFANRIRSNDLYINLYIAKNDADGNTRSIHKYKEVDFKLNDEEIKNIHSILQLCNAMIERNPIEYKYNSLISSIIHDNKFIEYNDIENKYYLNEIAYKVIYFERKYREYVQQLPVLMKGMAAYGYNVTSVDLGEFNVEGKEVFRDLKEMVKLAYDERLMLNTKHIEELTEMITDDRLNIYKEVLRGTFDIKKGTEWKEDLSNHKMIVKNIEVFEKVIPIFVSFSKQYDMDTIREIFEYCKNKNGTYNFAAINRIRILVNIVYNDNNKRLDIPIKEFMNDTYEFTSIGKAHKTEISRFISDCAIKYAKHESSDTVLIDRAMLTMDTLNKAFEKIFKCLVKTSRPTKSGIVKMERVELLWKEREWYSSSDQNEKLFLLSEFIDDVKSGEDIDINQ